MRPGGQQHPMSPLFSRRTCSISGLEATPHCEADLRGQFADPCVAQLSQAVSRRNQEFLFDNHDVFCTGRAIFLQSGLSCRKKNVSLEILVNACRQWNHQHGVCARMPIPFIERHNDYRPSSLARRIGMYPNKPDLTADRGAPRRSLSSVLRGKLAHCKIAPFFEFLRLLIREARIICLNCLAQRLTFLFPQSILNHFIQNGRDRYATPLFRHVLQKHNRFM